MREGGARQDMSLPVSGLRTGSGLGLQGVEGCGLERMWSGDLYILCLREILDSGALSGPGISAT